MLFVGILTHSLHSVIVEGLTAMQRNVDAERDAQCGGTAEARPRAESAGDTSPSRGSSSDPSINARVRRSMTKLEHVMQVASGEELVPLEEYGGSATVEFTEVLCIVSCGTVVFKLEFLSNQLAQHQTLQGLQRA